jgi:hypothetical protein
MDENNIKQGFQKFQKKVRDGWESTKGRGKSKMNKEIPEFEPENTSVIKVDELNLEEMQLTEQLYSNAGLEPVVEAGLKDYDKQIQQEDRFISKVFGPRGSDIKGYGEAVARRVAFAIYTLMNRQYGGKVGDLRSYILTLEDERDKAKDKYDELMGRVVGILGEEYRNLRTDSNEFMANLTTILGDNLKEAKFDQQALAESLADIDGLRRQVQNLNQEKTKLTESYESRLATQQAEHKVEVRDLNAKLDEQTKTAQDLKDRRDELTAEVKDLKGQTKEQEAKITKLEQKKANLESELSQLNAEHRELRAAIKGLVDSLPDEEVGQERKDNLYNFLLKDSKVPEMVIGGVGKFIDFRKYLGVSFKTGIKEACQRVGKILEAKTS